MAITKSYTFSNNTIADPAEVNQNFDDLVAAIRAAHHRDADGTKISYQDIASGWGLVPSGAILLWSGLISAIATGYVFCNGSNGTPDMRNKLALCPGQDSGGTYDTGDTGGAATINIAHAHAGPSHQHGGVDHLHGAGSLYTGSSSVNKGVDGYGSGDEVADRSHGHAIGGNTGAADRSLTTGAAGTGATDSQLSASQSVMNPFIAIVYMMKI